MHADIINRDDIRMLEPRDGGRLVMESRGAGIVGPGPRPQPLDRDDPAELDLLGPIDDPHPTPPEHAPEDIAVDRPAIGLGFIPTAGKGEGLVVTPREFLGDERGRPEFAQLVGDLGMPDGRRVDVGRPAGAEVVGESVEEADEEGVRVGGHAGPSWVLG